MCQNKVLLIRMYNYIRHHDNWFVGVIERFSKWFINIFEHLVFLRYKKVKRTYTSYILETGDPFEE